MVDMRSQGESLKCVERDKKYIVPEGQKIPAIGILNDREGETPGRFDKSNASALPRHHTPEETLRDIRQILKKRVNVENREFDLADLYVFALNGRNVMSQTAQALNQAFDELKSRN